MARRGGWSSGGRANAPIRSTTVTNGGPGAYPVGSTTDASPRQPGRPARSTRSRMPTSCIASRWLVRKRDSPPLPRVTRLITGALVVASVHFEGQPRPFLRCSAHPAPLPALRVAASASPVHSGSAPRSVDRQRRRSPGRSGTPGWKASKRLQQRRRGRTRRRLQAYRLSARALLRSGERDGQTRGQ